MNHGNGKTDPKSVIKSTPNSRSSPPTDPIQLIDFYADEKQAIAADLHALAAKGRSLTMDLAPEVFFGLLCTLQAALLVPGLSPEHRKIAVYLVSLGKRFFWDQKSSAIYQALDRGFPGIPPLKEDCPNVSH